MRVSGGWCCFFRRGVSSGFAPPRRLETRTPTARAPRTRPVGPPRAPQHAGRTHLDGRCDVFSGEVRRLKHHRHRHGDEPERPDVDVRASVANHRGSCNGDGNTQERSTAAPAAETARTAAAAGIRFTQVVSTGRAGQGAGRNADGRQAGKHRPARHVKSGMDVSFAPKARKDRGMKGKLCVPGGPAKQQCNTERG